MTDTKGRSIITATFADADLTHDIETRRYVTGVLMLINKYPIQLYSKRNNNMDNSTY